MRDIAGIANCVFCDSYFMIVFTQIELANYSGKQGKGPLKQLYMVSFVVLIIKSDVQRFKSNIRILMNN